MSVLDAAKILNIGVFSSVPFMQGKLLSNNTLPTFTDLKPSLRILQLIRSTPGIIAPLVGQKTNLHVQENLEILKIPPLSHNEFNNIIDKLLS